MTNLLYAKVDQVLAFNEVESDMHECFIAFYVLPW